MKYSKKQLKIINNKNNGYSIIKGCLNTGKTITALERIRKLLSSYCIDKEDNIIMILNNEEELKNAKDLYSKIQCEQFYQESFFEKKTSEYLKMQTIENIAFSLFKSYKTKNKIDYKFINLETKYEILRAILSAIENKSNCIEKYNIDLSQYNLKLNKSFLNRYDINFLIDEIKYIKSFNYTSDEYIASNRKAYNNIKIRRNSKARENIYSIMKIYNDIIGSMNYIDGEDLYIIALNEAENVKKIFTHGFIDNCEKYTKVQLCIIEKLLNLKSYSNIVYILNSVSNANKGSLAYLSYNKNLSEFGYDFRGRTNILKELYYSSEEKLDIKDALASLKKLNKKTYVDLKHNRIHTFMNDDNRKELYITDTDFEEKATNLSEIPVFNEIAAGKPILMNEHIEDVYYIPKEWIRGTQNIFILKIQGDSMIGKNIYDADLVVIDSTKLVNNNDIVAVEFGGEATLKTIKIEKDRILFKPENNKYEPIVIHEGEEFNILGVAVGIIKSEN